MKKPIQQILSGAAACVLAAVLLSGCASTPSGASSVPGSSPASDAAKSVVRVQTIKGPTGIGMVGLMDAQEKGTAQNDYTFTVASSPDELSAKILNNEVDIAAAPTNLAAVLYNKTGGQVTMLAVNTLGVLHILENGDTIQTAADLKGKTIYSTGQGANPEYVLRHILQKNNIDPDKDVKIEFVQENEELAALMDSGKASVAMVPEPTATTVLAKNTSIRRALDMTAEWDKVADGKLMMGLRDRAQRVPAEESGRRPQFYDRIRSLHPGYEGHRRCGRTVRNLRYHPQSHCRQTGDSGLQPDLCRRRHDENADKWVFRGFVRR